MNSALTPDRASPHGPVSSPAVATHNAAQGWRIIRVLASAAVHEAARAKVFLYVLLTSLALMLMSIPAASLSMADYPRMVVDLGIASITYSMAFLSIYLGIGSISGEIQKRTVYTIISKQASRLQFLLGKFLGVATIVGLAQLIGYGTLMAVTLVATGDWRPDIAEAAAAAIMESTQLVALAIVFSCWTRPLLAGGLTLILYVVGTSLHSLQWWLTRSAAPAQKVVAKFFYYLLPNFQIYDVRTELAHRVPIAWADTLHSVGYCAMYVTFLLCLAYMLFQKRDLK